MDEDYIGIQFWGKRLFYRNRTAWFLLPVKRLIDALIFAVIFALILSYSRSLSCRKQSTDLQSKSMDWFPYDTAFVMKELNYQMSMHEKKNYVFRNFSRPSRGVKS